MTRPFRTDAPTTDDGGTLDDPTMPSTTFEPPWAADCSPDAGLAESLIGLHRAERAPDSLVKRVAAGMQASAAVPAQRAATWQNRFDVLKTKLAAEPAAWALAAAISILVTWQQQAMRGSSEATDAHPSEAHSDEVTLTGVAVPGSLEWRIYGDSDGMGHCKSTFQLRPEGQASPVRVSWTRCDLPDALSDELRRSYSPLKRAADLRVSLGGRWRRPGEFDAIRLRSQP